MKKVLKIITLVFFTSFFSFAQNIYFPDANFKSKLVLASPQNQTANSFNVLGNSKIDLNNDGEISQSEAIEVKMLFLFNSNISDLTGINFFYNLTDLSVYYNNLNTLNILNLIHLKGLTCILNNLSTLDLTGLNELENIAINSNSFTSFDVSQLPNLKEFQCSNNLLTFLDFSNNPLFKELVCSNNNLTSINIKNGSFQNINLAFPLSNNDCWKVGNPNLTTICADENEVAPLTTFLASCNSGAQPSIDSSCVLANEKFTKNEFLVFPNPANSTINVNFNINFNCSDNFNLELIDTQGRVLQSKNVSNSQTSLDILGLDNGIYFLKMNAGNRTQIERIIKE